MVISGRQIQPTQALLGIEQIDLASGLRDIRTMQAFGDLIVSRTDTLVSVMAAFEKAGLEFPNHERPGVRMKAAN